jgi:hypothetical protein
MKARLFIVLLFGLMCFSACDMEDDSPIQAIEQQPSDSGEEEEEGTTSEVV